MTGVGMVRRGTDEQRKAYQRAYYHANKERKIRGIRYSRILREYGLTPDQVTAMYDAAGDACECCGRAIARQGSGAPKKDVGNIDHCHATGKVRGILCNSCNKAIGMLKDKPELAVAYLDKTR